MLVALRRDLARHAQRDHRHRGPALLRELRRRPPRHRPRAVQDVVAAQGGRRAARRSPSSSSRTRCARRTERTVFQKLREAALAYHLTRKWSKSKILTEYLNSIYFGNGAYGIESAARTYFGNQPDHRAAARAAARCASSELEPDEAALLAGVVATPSGYDPVAHPQAAKRAAQPRAAATCATRATRRARVPRRAHRGPARADRHQAADRERPRRRTSRPGCASSSSTASARAARSRAGSKVTTTLDLDLQHAAEQAVKQLPGATRRARRPRSSRSTTSTGEVRAMVGGRDYATRPFNLATQGQRQPGSAIKPFILADGARARASAPGSVWPSRKRVFTVPGTRRQGEVRRQQLRGQATPARRRSRARLTTPTTRSTRTSASRSARSGSRALARAHGHPHAGLVELRDDARRPQAGRHAARHGPRLRDASPRAACGSAARSARSDRRPVGHPRGVDVPPRRQAGVRARTIATSRSSRRGSRRRDRRDHADRHLAGHGQARAALGRGQFAAGKTGTTEN